MYVVCGVAVSPGVPRRSERGSEGRSRSLPLRSGVRSLSFCGATGGGAGAGARSPGLMPAFSAAAVGRNTLTCREGGGIAGRGAGDGVCLTSAPLVGAKTSGAMITSSTTGGSSTTGCSTAGGGATSSITGASARAAGANFLTSLVTGGFAAGAGEGAEGVSTGSAATGTEASITGSAS